ncbi:MAG: ribokinase [Chloroflexota bacterium]
MVVGRTVVVVGSANVDLIGRASRLPGPGETVLGEGFAMLPGGKGANQAVACARLGANSRFVGRIGRDAFGDFVLERMRREGVDTACLGRDAEVATGVALINVDAQGRNSILVAPGANGRLSPADVELASAALAADALLLQLEIPLPAVAKAAALARAQGAVVILNPAPARTLPDELWGLVDVLTPNQSELCLLSGLPVDGRAACERAARSLLERGVRAVVVTLGAEGALLVSDGTVVQVAAYPVHVIDTTGAGDAFSAGLAVALAEGRSLREAISFANATGGLSTTALGAQEALPTRAQVETLLAET